MEYVLFSPIGGTDPISNYRDGACLHITRVYQPSKVYLYFSKEMMVHHKTDNRYMYCLEKLSETLMRSIEFQAIERSDLASVQKFDDFYDEFDKIIGKIRAENPSAKILLNISSGTPAMKSTLMILASLNYGGDLLAIQVDTPIGRQNPHEEGRETYDPEYYWELNEDNNPDAFFNRCNEYKGINLDARIKINTLCQHIMSYDYTAAAHLADTVRDSISKKAYSMVKAAECRYNLNQSGADSYMTGIKHSFFPVQGHDEKSIFEYLCALEIKLKRGEYADFLRGCTPAILEVFRNYLKQKYHIYVDEYCEKLDNVLYITPESLSRDEFGRAVLKVLNTASDDGIYKKHYITSRQLEAMIEVCSDSERDKESVQLLRQVEVMARNEAAHTLVAVDKDWVTKRGGIPPEQVITEMKRLLMSAKTVKQKEAWNTYEEMNQAIVKELISPDVEK